MVDEARLIRTIVLGADWQEVLENIIVEEDLNPLVIDLVKLSDAFMNYMQEIKKFDFRIPARFILVAAILLRMKCELLLEEEEEKARKEIEKLPEISLENIPQLSAPLIRKPIRKVTLSELITALNKALEFKEKKETKQIRLRRAVETLIEPEEDVEIKISTLLGKISKAGEIKFSDLVPDWKRNEIVDTFMPLLYLCMRSRIYCDQPEMFKEIFIKIRE